MDKIKQIIVDRIVAALNNPHTTGSALAIGGLKIASVIWPKQKSTFDEITAVAVVWLGISAGDAKPKSLDTSFLNNPNKPSVQPPPADTTQTKG